MHHKVALELPICLYRWAQVVNHGHVWDMPRPRVAGTMAQVLPPPPPPVSMARAMFLLSRGGGGALARGAMFLLSKGGSIDTRTGGPLTRVLVKNPKKKFLVYAVSSLCH